MNRARQVGRLLTVMAVFATVLVVGPVASVFAGTGFTDVPDGHIFKTEITWLADQGITQGCNPPANDQFCPDGYVTRGQMAAFLTRALGLTDPGTVDFIDDNTSVFESDIEKLATAKITLGCNPPVNDRFCPEDNVTRGQMATFLFRALAGASDPLVIGTKSLPDAIVGAAYTESLTVTGGAAPYSWSLDSGALPSGLALSTAGTISGTATTAGTSNFTVRVEDSGVQSKTANLAITVDDSLTIVTTSLPYVGEGEAYNETLTVGGGTPPYAWSLAVGSSLPAGLTLSSGGTISGTASAAGAVAFTVKVTDSDSLTDTQNLSITVLEPVSIVTTSPLPDGSTGANYNQTLAASGGAAPYTWSTSAVDLPAGVSLSTAGVLGGMPTQGQNSSFLVTVTDKDGRTADQLFTLFVDFDCASVDVSAGECDALEAFYYAAGGPNWTNTTNGLNPWLTGSVVCDWHGVTCTGTVGNRIVTRLELDSSDGVLSDGDGLSGTIAPEIGSLPNLLILRLSGASNNLTGSIPTEIGDLSELITLILNGNSLSGSIPVSIGNLTKLDKFEAGSNSLTGSIPSAIGSLPTLNYLSLARNDLSGSIPPTFGTDNSLLELRLNGNALDGTIPTSFGGYTNLTVLELQNNALTGSIPTEMGSMTALTTLLLSGNSLSGVILDTFKNLTNLPLDDSTLGTGLDLSSNGCFTAETTGAGSVEEFLNARDATWNTGC